MGWRSTRAVSAIAAALVGTDQLSKLWVQQNLPLYSSIEIIPGLFRLSHYANRGGIGGIGWRSPATLPILVAGSFLIIVLLLVLYRHYTHSAAPSWRMDLFLATAVAPLISHSLDRLRQGFVVDFVHFTGMPIFNFADLLPNLAIVLLAAEMAAHLRSRRRGILTATRQPAPELYS